MKHEKKANLHASMLYLFCISAILSLSSCARQSGTVATAPTPSPAEAKMEAQSGNWKVIVTSVNQVPRETVDPFMGPVTEGPENKYDTLQLTVDIAYMGPSGNIKSPTAALVDSSGQKIAAVKTALDTPDAIYMMDYGPGYTSLKTLYTGDARSTPDPTEEKKTEKAAKEILNWIDPQPGANKRPRALKGEEKFSVIYYFQDPKEYANLKLMFEDVPSIPLKAPQSETNSNQSGPGESQPAQTATPPPAEGKIDGQSKNWKVIVTSVKTDPNDTTMPTEPRDSLEVALDVEYTGPARLVKPPTASLVDGNGKRHEGELRSSTVVRWIFPSGPPEAALRPGVKLGVTFSFKDPKDYSNLKLVFDDVPPILLKAP